MEPVTTTAAVTALAKSPVGQKIIGAVGGAIGSLTKSYHQDNVFIDGRRDPAFDALRANGFPESEWGAYTKNVSHSAVPNRRLGGTYEDAYGEFYRYLVDDIKSYLNFKKPGMGDFFYAENTRLAKERLPAAEQFKGLPAEAIYSAVKNYKNQSSNVFETANLLDGIGVGQAYVDNGVVKVPLAQQGEGIFSSLSNYAAAVLTPSIANSGINGGQILSQVAGGISGQQQLASNGQVVLTGGVQVGGSVTKNTTSQGSGNGTGGNMILLVIAAVAAAFFFFGKKLFGR